MASLEQQLAAQTQTAAERQKRFTLLNGTFKRKVAVRSTVLASLCVQDTAVSALLHWLCTAWCLAGLKVSPGGWRGCRLAPTPLSCAAQEEQLRGQVEEASAQQEQLREQLATAQAASQAAQQNALQAQAEAAQLAQRLEQQTAAMEAIHAQAAAAEQAAQDASARVSEVRRRQGGPGVLE